MAGVSLVADAAEHLERTAGELYSANQGASAVLVLELIS